MKLSIVKLFTALLSIFKRAYTEPAGRPIADAKMQSEGPASTDLLPDEVICVRDARLREVCAQADGMLVLLKAVYRPENQVEGKEDSIFLNSLRLVYRKLREVRVADGFSFPKAVFERYVDRETLHPCSGNKHRRFFFTAFLSPSDAAADAVDVALYHIDGNAPIIFYDDIKKAFADRQPNFFDPPQKLTFSRNKVVAAVETSAFDRAPNKVPAGKMVPQAGGFRLCDALPEELLPADQENPHKAVTLSDETFQVPGSLLRAVCEDASGKPVLLLGTFRNKYQEEAAPGFVMFSTVKAPNANRIGKSLAKRLPLPETVVSRYLDLDALRKAAQTADQHILFTVILVPNSDDTDVRLIHIGDAPPVFTLSDYGEYRASLDGRFHDLTPWSEQRARQKNHYRDTLKELIDVSGGKPILFQAMLESETFKTGTAKFDYVTFISLRLLLRAAKKTKAICNHINLPKRNVEKYLDLSSLTTRDFCIVAYPTPYCTSNRQTLGKQYDWSQRTGLKLAEKLPLPAIFPRAKLPQWAEACRSLTCDLTEWYDTHQELYF